MRIGFGGTDMLDYRYDRTILKITGDLYFNSKTKIGVDAKINVSGELHLGHNFDITGDATIICAKKIFIGDNTMIAWQSILMETLTNYSFYSFFNNFRRITGYNNTRSNIFRHSCIDSYDTVFFDCNTF